MSPLIGFMLRQVLVRSDRARLDQLEPGPLYVFGYFGQSNGIAAGGRATLAALERAGFDPVAVDLEEHFASHRAFSREALSRRGGVCIFHCNPPEAVAAISRFRPQALAHTYRIGYWAWELPSAPRAWLQAQALFHEVWAPSEFVANSLDQERCEIRVMPHSIDEGGGMSQVLTSSRWPANALRCLAMADLNSSVTRKNPIGAIRAYREAVPEPGSSSHLIVKLRSADQHAGWQTAIRDACADRYDITIVIEEMTKSQVSELIRSADIFISLHRSEGFGLVIAESMACGGVPVATAWSGNMDFMHGLDPCLVPYKLTAVSDPTRIYRGARNVWAEPDIPAAGRRLAYLLNNAEARSSLKTRCKERIRMINQAWLRDNLLAAAWTRYVSGSHQRTLQSCASQSAGMDTRQT